MGGGRPRVRRGLLGSLWAGAAEGCGLAKEGAGSAALGSGPPVTGGTRVSSIAGEGICVADSASPSLAFLLCNPCIRSAREPAKNA